MTLFASEVAEVASNPQIGQVAKVLIEDLPPHLAKPFDYLVPAGIEVAVGTPVRVVLHGARKTGWIVELANSSTYDLKPIARVLSPLPLVSAQTVKLCHRLAQRYAIAPVDLISVAAGSRHLTTLREYAKRTGNAARTQTVDSESENQRKLSPQRLIYDVPATSPNTWIEAISATYTQTSPRGATLIIVPTDHEVERLQAAFKKYTDDVLTYTSTADEATKTQVELAFRNGEKRIVIGTRAAIWLDHPQLSTIVIWDYENEQFWPQRHPRVDALTIAMERSLQLGCDLLLFAYVRSLRAEMALTNGFAKLGQTPSLTTPTAGRTRVKRLVPQAQDDAVQARYRRETLPLIAQRLLHKLQQQAHASGLIVVPRRGFITAIACRHCRKIAVCEQCGNNLQPNATGALYCQRCRSLPQPAKCSCGGEITRAVRIGAQQFRAELARSFPRWQVDIAETSAPSDPNAHTHTLTIATQTQLSALENSYDLAVFMEADNLERSGALWAEYVTLTRIETLVAHVEPSGSCIVVDGSEDLNRAYLQHQYPALAKTELHERNQLALWPTRRIIRFTTQNAQVLEVAQQLCAQVEEHGGNCLQGSAITGAGEPVVQLAISIAQAQAATGLLWELRQLASAAGNDFYYQVDPH